MIKIDQIYIYTGNESYYPRRTPFHHGIFGILISAALLLEIHNVCCQAWQTFANPISMRLQNGETTRVYIRWKKLYKHMPKTKTSLLQTNENNKRMECISQTPLSKVVHCNAVYGKTDSSVAANRVNLQNATRTKPLQRVTFRLYQWMHFEFCNVPFTNRQDLSVSALKNSLTWSFRDENKSNKTK